jgi:hypothetical protein
VFYLNIILKTRTNVHRNKKCIGSLKQKHNTHVLTFSTKLLGLPNGTNWGGNFGEFASLGLTLEQTGGQKPNNSKLTLFTHIGAGEERGANNSNSKKQSNTINKKHCVKKIGEGAGGTIGNQNKPQNTAA